MDEYIERQKLYNNLVLLAKYETGERQQGILGCAETVRIFPAADVAPVRHGKWVCIRKGYGEYECSVCHGVDSDCSDYYGTHVVTEQDYCPNCGSRMDGDDDE